MKFLKNAKLLIITTLLATLFMMFAIYWLYGGAKAQLYKDVESKYYHNLNDEINSLINHRREASVALALTLSENHEIRSFVCQECHTHPDTSYSLHRLLEELALHAQYNGFWIQVLDKEGVSRYRSWTDKMGDSLVSVRSDVRKMLRSPQVIQSVSVGKFSLTLKSMVPLLDENNQMIGVVEVISLISPLAERLKNSQGVESIILVDKRYKRQLTKANSERFIQDYYVANNNASKENVDFLENVADQRFARSLDFTVNTQRVITQHALKNDAGLVLGYWFTISSDKVLDVLEIKQLKKRYLYVAMIVAVLSLMLMFVYLFKTRSDTGLSYYRHILDSASEIIFVSNHQRIIEANQQFFEFYSQFSSIDEFLQYYDCVCDTFENQDGYLQPEMDGVFWLDYVLQNPNKQHKAIIKKEGVLYYFQVKVAEINLYDSPLFSVIMHDITEQEMYKQRLELLSETDTLTGISNRLVFNRTLIQEIQRSHRYHSDLALLMFDIDYFKKINDTFGHEVGDKVLITLSEEITRLLRETDVFCRIGGEEFIIVMPETSLEFAYQTAERLRKAIENLPANILPTQLTVSFGVASMTRWDNDKTLFKRVDKALYKAKENGRNRVEKAEIIENPSEINNL